MENTVIPAVYVFNVATWKSTITREMKQYIPSSRKTQMH